MVILDRVDVSIFTGCPCQCNGVHSAVVRFWFKSVEFDVYGADGVLHHL